MLGSLGGSSLLHSRYADAADLEAYGVGEDSALHVSPSSILEHKCKSFELIALWESSGASGPPLPIR